jgi:ribonucleoside-diphosphate reductase alpha chain
MSALTVTKKSGAIVPFEISKIKKMIDFATQGLEVNPLLLESKINLTFKDKIKTSDIQQNLIISGIELIDTEEPDWVTVVGRLATKLLHSEIYKNTKMDHSDYLKFLHYAITHGFYRKDILNYYSDKDIKDVVEVLDKNKDYNFTIAQVLALKDKYLVKIYNINF